MASKLASVQIAPVQIHFDVAQSFPCSEICFSKILGQEEKLGRVRAGFTADLIVVNGNPLENLKVLYPTGTEEIRDWKTGAQQRRRVDH